MVAAVSAVRARERDTGNGLGAMMNSPEASPDSASASTAIPVVMALTVAGGVIPAQVRQNGTTLVPTIRAGDRS